ncbi:hypothetical protein EMCG_04460 [[Emmonsia] crescens]|uniref:Uncharacterized protein n=1 Tax=[Emmonsia] crescens TaxID=73230 RepID=A0A0G2IYU2_9EURO|nr:hypothetical protein EMCG_04460 [Emmonsia crescens UAMH 3008]
MTTPRYKAAQGLRKIPSSEEEWKEAIEEHGLMDRTLGQLCLEGKFSASRVSKEAFLIVRCLWPPKKGPEETSAHIVDLDYFYSDDHAADAQKLTYQGLLGLDKLETLYHIVCIPKERPNRTPPRYSGTLADGLGPFSMLVNLYNQLCDRSIQALMNEDRLSGAPEKQGFYDAMQPLTSEELAGTVPQSPSQDSVYLEDIEMEDVEYEASTFSFPLAPASPQAEELIVDELRRTPTETLVADFLVTLLGGLASLVQGLGPRPLCIANSFETTYTFGPRAKGMLSSEPVLMEASLSVDLLREHHAKPS